MPPSDQSISKEIIDSEIYKIFEQFKNNPKLTTAEYLKHFNTTLFQTTTYRKIKYDYDSLIKLILYKKIKGFRFDTKLTKHLRQNPKDKYQLGFSQTPDRTQIGYFTNHILDQQTQDLLDYAAEKIIEVSEKFGIILDIKTLEPTKTEKQTKDRNQRRLKRENTSEICKLFKKRITPFIKIKQHHNTKYPKQELLNLLLHLGLTQDFAENGSKVYREIRRHGPDADTLLYHLKKYDNLGELQKMFENVSEVVWNMARQANLFDPRKKLDVAIDTTEWFYYGRNGVMVTSKKPERGTSKCYKFATINIVENGKRFTLFAIPVNVLEDREKIISKLVLYALKRIKIRYVYIDRGFFDSVSINTLRNLHVKYLMPAIQQYNVKRIMAVVPTPSVVPDFKLKQTPVTLVFVMLKDRVTGEPVKRVFATNISFSNNDAGLAELIGRLYRKRWGIETSYRVKKHSYRGKTTSKNYMIRFFYFMFSVLLYNLWTLADIFIWMYLYGKVGVKHMVTSKLFGTILSMVDPGGG